MHQELKSFATEGNESSRTCVGVGAVPGPNITANYLKEENFKSRFLRIMGI